MYNPSAGLPARVSAELVAAGRLDASELERVRELLERHLELTGSPRAGNALAGWFETSRHLWRVTPRADVASIWRTQEGTLRGASA